MWVAFLGYAVGRDELMVKHQQSAAQLRTVIIQELEHLQSEKLVRADIDPEVESQCLASHRKRCQPLFAYSGQKTQH